MRCPFESPRQRLSQKKRCFNSIHLFSGLGHVGKPVSFVLNPHEVPVQAPRHRVPVVKRASVNLQLNEMVRDGKLAMVEEPTAWCSNMTAVEPVKPDGSVKIRLCQDPSQTIIKAIVFMVLTLEETLPALGTHRHKCFTIVDAQCRIHAEAREARATLKKKKKNVDHSELTTS